MAEETTAPLRVLRGEHLEESEFLDFGNNALSPEKRKAAMRHLDGCPRCREILGALHRDDDDGETRLKDPLVGAMLGEYRVDEALSRGGMGAVYRGLQPVIGKKVAIKVLVPEIANDPDQMHRLLAEARAVNAIRHPNIIDIFSFGELPGGKHYFVMELLEGQPLNELFRERAGKFTLGEVLTILEQTMSALGAAHSANVVHRDLKLGNLFVSTLANKTWHVTVLDFGLAKNLDGGPQSSANLVMGTPGFMAPEQILGEPVTGRADLYAMGVVAWLLLTGKEPFSARSQVDLMAKHLEAPLPSLSRLLPECPLPLVSLVERLLAKRPEQRPPSALEVQDELRRIRKEMAGRDTVKAPTPVMMPLETLHRPHVPGQAPTVPMDAEALARELDVTQKRDPAPVLDESTRSQRRPRARPVAQTVDAPTPGQIETEPDRAAVSTHEAVPRPTEPARPALRPTEPARGAVSPTQRATDPAKPSELPSPPSRLAPFFAGLGLVLGLCALGYLAWRLWG